MSAPAETIAALICAPALTSTPVDIISEYLRLLVEEKKVALPPIITTGGTSVETPTGAHPEGSKDKVEIKENME